MKKQQHNNWTVKLDGKPSSKYLSEEAEKISTHTLTMSLLARSDIIARNSGLHKQRHWTDNFFYLLLLRLNHFCLEFAKYLRPKRMPAHILTIDIYDSHTQADKIDRLLYQKNKLYKLQFTTAYYSYKGHDPWHTL